MEDEDEVVAEEEEDTEDQENLEVEVEQEEKEKLDQEVEEDEADSVEEEEEREDEEELKEDVEEDEGPPPLRRAKPTTATRGTKKNNVGKRDGKESTASSRRFQLDSFSSLGFHPDPIHETPLGLVR